MRIKWLNIAVFPLLLAGCAAHEGSYWPECKALAGDTITLTRDRFEWDKFTDAVKIDADGNPIDAFPGYPKRGTYRIEGTAVAMQPESGGALSTMYLVRHHGKTYLLNGGQFASWQETGIVETCALVRASDEEN